MILTRPIQDEKMSFNLFKNTSVSFRSVLRFSLYKLAYNLLNLFLSILSLLLLL